MSEIEENKNVEEELVSEKVDNRKLAVGYCRVSTLMQGEEEHFGITAQENMIKEYAEANGYKIIRWYVDKVSGVKEEREELDKILYGGSVANPPIEAVIVAKSDRLSRDLKLYFYYLYTLEKIGVKLLSATEQFEDESLANIYRSLLLFVAEQERKNITVRTWRGRYEKAAQGGFAGGVCPFGYTTISKELIVNEDEARAVRLIFRLKEAGYSDRKIIKALENASCYNRKGGNFCRGSITAILGNKKLYEGYVSYSDQEFHKGKHEPIIEDGFYKCGGDKWNYSKKKRIERQKLKELEKGGSKK